MSSISMLNRLALGFGAYGSPAVVRAVQWLSTRVSEGYPDFYRWSHRRLSQAKPPSCMLPALRLVDPD